MPRTRVVCTIGPASWDTATLRSLILAGMSVARLNFSHGDHVSHCEAMQRIRDAAAELSRPVAILCDLQGPKLRVGMMQPGGVLLKENMEVTLTTRPVMGHEGEVPVQYESLPRDVQGHDRILLDDGLMELEVARVEGTEVICRVIVGGLLQSNKGLNLPRVSLSTPTITPKDRGDLRFAVEQGADWVALSFVRSDRDIEDLKGLIQEYDSQVIKVGVVAKIEKREAIVHINDIIAAADGVMIARGDLAIEASPEEVPMMQKEIISRCNYLGKPVITATQMLDSMIRSPRPTRAEVSDVANAILDGTDALMLSGETAVGSYPIASVQTMMRIAAQVERAGCAHPPESSTVRLDAHISSSRNSHTIAEAVSHAACQTAHELGAVAIVTPTVSGYTARMVAKYRPAMPIVATTHNPRVQRQLMLQWGIQPLLSDRADDTDQTIAEAIRTAQRSGIIRAGDTVVLTAGSAGSGPGTTNLLEVQVVGPS